MQAGKADLHVHTSFSDGRLSPAELVEKAYAAGLSAISVTDHDTVEGIEEAHDACDRAGLQLIAGAEISVEEEGEEIHVLAYAFNPGDAGLLSLLASQRKRRRDRATRFLERLRQAGVRLPVDEEIGFGEDGAIGRPHLAELIVTAGAAESMNEAFERFLVPGTETFVPKELPAAEFVFDAVHAAAGVCVLAHPGNGMSHQRVLRLIAAGLDGLEVVHPSHDETLTTYYGNLARERDLIATGGSDFHGWRDDDEANLGAYTVAWPADGKLSALRTL